MKLLRKKDQPIEPRVKADLAKIEAALIGNGEPDAGGLEELALELSADRPVPRDQFLAALDERVAAGFPPPPRDTDPETAEGEPSGPHPIDWSRLGAGLRRVWMPVVAGAAGAAVVAVAITSSGVVTGGGGSDEAPQVGQAPDVSTIATPEATKNAAPDSGAAGEAGGDAPAPTAIAPDQSISPPPSGGRSDGLRERQQVKTAELTLGASPGDIEDVADGTIRVADRYKGFVISSQVSSGDGADVSATIQLRIPSANVQDAVADLSKLGHMIERTQGTEDVTARFISLRTRLTNATKEREALLKQLSSVDTPQETVSLRAQLRTIDSRIAGIRAQQKQLNNRVDFSNISVSVQADADANAGDDKFTPGDALDHAGDILGAALGAILIGLAILIPLVAIGALIWFVTTAARRRQRERALDSEEQ